MKNATGKKSLRKIGFLLVAVIMMMAVIFTACGQQAAEAPAAPADSVEQATESQSANSQSATEQPADNQATEEQVTDDQIADVQEETEVPAIPLPTNYIVLSYPAELENEVKVAYENIHDGQTISFTTDFTGEELLLFRFSISTSGDDGFALGVLEDEKVGPMVVCVHVEEYTNGNWSPEDFNKLNALQERVNDIIVQFYDDPRFVPNH